MYLYFNKFNKKNIGTIYKTNSIDINGIETVIDIDLSQVNDIIVNFQVGENTYTDSVIIKNPFKNIIQIPFKTTVLKQGLNSFEVVAYMKNGDIKPSQTCEYYIEKSIENINPLQAETKYPILIKLIDSVEEGIKRIDEAILKIPSKEELKGEKGDKGDKGEPGLASIAINDTLTSENTTYSSKKIDEQFNTIAINAKNFYGGSWSDAIQLAHDSLPSNGGTIIIPQGQILEVDKTINITKPNVHVVSLAGKYKSTGFKASVSGLTMFNVTNYGFNPKNIYILGDGTTAQTDLATTIAFNITGSATNDVDCLFDNVMIENCKLAVISQGRNIMINKECVISNCQSGLLFTGSGGDLRGVEVYCRFHSIGKGTVLDSYCLHFNPTSNYSDVDIGIYADDCKKVITGGFVGSINKCNGTRAYGELCDIDLTSMTISAEKRYLKISDNIISFYNTSNNSCGIKIKGYSKFKISSNFINNSQLHGIYLNGVSLSKIENNTLLNCCYTSDNDAIHIDSTSTLNYINDNLIQITDTSGNNKIRHGIHVEGHENIFSDNKVFGIDTDNAFWIITGKTAYGDTRILAKQNRTYYGTGAPTVGRWNQGDIVYNLQPTQAKNITYWSCISGGNSGTWRANGVGQGTTSERPAMTQKDIGYMYFDTDLQKMMYFNGTGYVATNGN